MNNVTVIKLKSKINTKNVVYNNFVDPSKRTNGWSLNKIWIRMMHKIDLQMVPLHLAPLFLFDVDTLAVVLIIPVNYLDRHVWHEILNIHALFHVSCMWLWMFHRDHDEDFYSYNTVASTYLCGPIGIGVGRHVAMWRIVDPQDASWSSKKKATRKQPFLLCDRCNPSAGSDHHVLLVATTGLLNGRDRPDDETSLVRSAVPFFLIKKRDG